MPDTRAVAMQKINALNTTLDRVTGTIVKNPNFQHEGLLPRTPETPGQPMSTSGKMPEPASLTLTPTERVLGKMGPGPAPGTQPPPGKPEKRPIPNDERAKQAVYKQMGITAPPHAGREPEKFEQFLGALRQHMGALRPGTPPEQLDGAVGDLGRAIARKQGVTWPPAR
jgi:hypothetical protein